MLTKSQIRTGAEPKVAVDVGDDGGGGGGNGGGGGGGGGGHGMCMIVMNSSIKVRFTTVKER